MTAVVGCKIYKIKPENEVRATGIVLKCKSAGISRIGVGRASKPVRIFKVSLKTDGSEKPLNVKVREDGSGTQSPELPLKDGDVVNIVYDRLKPKRCNIEAAEERQ
ncbi:MAG: hypothetical protein HFK08_02585 [Clostridia bacterium]|nr:hypothetical protein [Clostridia bacterium]